MAKNTKKKINYPSFFKIMLDVEDFTKKLEVPPAFVKYLRHKKVSREFTLSLKFGPVGSSWKVTVEKKRSDEYWFTKGWSKMAKDLELVQPDFLVFYLVAKDAFQVAVYDQTCCAVTLENEVEEEEEEEEGGEEEEEEEGPAFQVTLSKQNKHCCILPRGFAVKTGLCNMEAVEIKDLAGSKWDIKLVSRKASYKSPGRDGNLRYDLRTGWREFYRENGLAPGDKLKFKHVGGCMMMLVEKTKNQI